MAIGDASDMEGRIKSLLPSSWFNDKNPIRDAVVTGTATGLSWAYTLYLYAKQQTRLLTSTDGWLELFANDFFGDGLPREGKTDASYRAWIQTNLFRERGTRYAISKVLYDLTGKYPDIVELQRPLDTGGYGYGAGYGVGGAYGSRVVHHQAFVKAYRPDSTGIPYIGGYGSSVSGYGVASYGSYVSESSFITGITDSDIFAAVASVKMEGTIVWVNISQNPVPYPTYIGIDFAFDQSILY